MLGRRGDTNGASQSRLELVRYGRDIAAGGTELDFMVGSACELMGTHRLTNLLAGLTAQQCHTASRALEELERSREPKEAIERRERAWQRGSFSIVDRVKMMIETRSLNPGKEWALLAPGFAYEDRVQQVRLALLRVAARAYELETGRPPAAASDLVPHFLSSVPVDPETSKRLDLQDKPRSRSLE